MKRARPNKCLDPLELAMCAGKEHSHLARIKKRHYKACNACKRDTEIFEAAWDQFMQAHNLSYFFSLISHGHYPVSREENLLILKNMNDHVMKCTGCQNMFSVLGEYKIQNISIGGENLHQEETGVWQITSATEPVPKTAIRRMFLINYIELFLAVTKPAGNA